MERRASARPGAPTRVDARVPHRAVRTKLRERVAVPRQQPRPRLLGLRLVADPESGGTTTTE
jgi:hypothetical protein